MKMLHVICGSLLLVIVAFAQRPAREAHGLIGTWRLVEYADLDKDGKWEYWYGEHPRGYVVYDATGHVHVQIMKVPPLARFPEANWDIDKPPSPEHALAAYNAYNAYFGTYTVDARGTWSFITSKAAWRPITPTRTSRALSNWKATGSKLPMARPTDVCWSVCLICDC